VFEILQKQSAVQSLLREIKKAWLMDKPSLPLLAYVEYPSLRPSIRSVGIVASPPYGKAAESPREVLKTWQYVIVIPDVWNDELCVRAQAHLTQMPKWAKFECCEVRNVSRVKLLEECCDLSFALTHWHSRIRQLAKARVSSIDCC
jgi:hypothetical protein